MDKIKQLISIGFIIDVDIYISITDSISLYYRKNGDYFFLYNKDTTTISPLLINNIPEIEDVIKKVKSGEYLFVEKIYEQ